MNSIMENLIKYMCKKEPLTKAILTNSKIKINDNKVNVELKVKGSAFLQSKKFDKGLEHLLLNLYNNKYTVEYVDTVTKEDIEKYEEYLKKQEKEALTELKRQADEAREESMKEERQKVEEREKVLAEKEAGTAIKNGGSAVATTNEEKQDDNSPLIYGRNATMKNPFIKIIDISPDVQKVCIEGEVISTDSREIKNEKVIIMFNLYDGTSTITCKAFVEKAKFKTVMKRITSAKGLKLDGNAAYDNFAKEITVMANTIIETAGNPKKKRKNGPG